MSQPHLTKQKIIVENYAAKDTCNDPDANINCCFINMPSHLTPVMEIAPKEEAGERIVIKGTIFKKDGVTPYPNLTLYAYQTDNNGYYAKKGTEKGFQKWHGHLHGWCKTDNNGRYEIHSIRPAPYPDNTMPAHIHCAVKLPQPSPPFYINDFVFADDNLVNKGYLSTLNSPGGTGVVQLHKKENGHWEGERNITLQQ